MTDFRLMIGTKAFRHWTSIEITQSVDCFSQIRFTAPFEPESRAFREMFRPLSFSPIEVTIGDTTRCRRYQQARRPEREAAVIDGAAFLQRLRPAPQKLKV